MKHLFFTVGSVIIAATLIVALFAIRQIESERTALISDLELRTRLLSESLKESIEPNYLISAQKTLQKIVDQFSNRERLEGIAIYDNKNTLLISSKNLSKDILENTEIVSNAMDADTEMGDFIDLVDKKLYFYVNPIHQETSVAGALLVVQKAQYIDARILDLWKNNLLRLCIQIFLFSLTIVIIIKLAVLQPLTHLIQYIQSVKSGSVRVSDTHRQYMFFHPLAREITSITTSLKQARSAASFEARMRLEKLDTPWTAERLGEFIKIALNNPLYVVSNKEPYIHQKTKSGMICQVPAGGLVTALNPVMEACGGMWIAHGSGSADHETVDHNDRISVPPNDPKYTLKRVWLTEEEIKGYYQGFSNEALWPLFQTVHVRPLFRKEDWEQYCCVNAKFAKKLLEELKNVKNPIVLVQDYHLALLPTLIKKARPDVKIGLFWHIPWPSPEAFSICPWKREILEGMLGADIIGFHIQQFGNNFMDTVNHEIESRVDFDQFSIIHKGHQSFIKPFPISVAFTGNELRKTNNKEDVLKKFHLSTKYFALGVDRMDYTKGIMERLKAIEFFLDRHPDYLKQFTFLQIAAPSRETVPQYQQFTVNVQNEVTRINKKFGDATWNPVILLNQCLSHEEINPLYEIADMCIVTSLHDGMNLVAKEFVAAQSHENGVLILSQFTGAARELKEALIVNPYSAEETSNAIYMALMMSSQEKKERMKRMRSIVLNYNIYRWSAEFIKAVADIV